MVPGPYFTTEFSLRMHISVPAHVYCTGKEFENLGIFSTQGGGVGIGNLLEGQGQEQ